MELEAHTLVEGRPVLEEFSSSKINYSKSHCDEEYRSSDNIIEDNGLVFQPMKKDFEHDNVIIAMVTSASGKPSVSYSTLVTLAIVFVIL
jgi:hypothetical protein